MFFKFHLVLPNDLVAFLNALLIDLSLQEEQGVFIAFYHQSRPMVLVDWSLSDGWPKNWAKNFKCLGFFFWKCWMTLCWHLIWVKLQKILSCTQKRISVFLSFSLPSLLLNLGLSHSRSHSVLVTLDLSQLVLILVSFLVLLTEVGRIGAACEDFSCQREEEEGVR